MADPRREQLREQARDFAPHRYMPIDPGELTTLLDMLDRIEDEGRLAWRENARLRAALAWALGALGEPPCFTGEIADWERAKALLAGETEVERG